MTSNNGNEKVCKHNANFGIYGKDPYCDYCGEKVDVRVLSIGEYENYQDLEQKLADAHEAIKIVEAYLGPQPSSNGSHKIYVECWNLLKKHGFEFPFKALENGDAG